MSFIKAVTDEQERTTPVRTAIKARAADIQAARGEGKPLNAIYRALRREGHPVGKGYSSFRAAVRYLDQHGWPGESIPAAPVVASSAPASANVDTGPAHAERDRFVDDRNPSDF